MEERGPDGPAPVTVLTVRDPGVLAVAKSVLDEAGIEYFAKGEDVQHLTPLMLWVELQVGAPDEAEARTLLADLAQP
jgi:Putative prokaryotic signal transducing protein